MTEQRHAPVAAGQRPREVDHAAQGGHEHPRVALEIGQPARQRLGVAAVGGQVEGDCHQPGPRQRDGEGMHQLLGPCEAVRHHHHRQGAARRRGTENGDGNRVHHGRLDRKTVVRGLDAVHRQGHQHERDDGGGEAEDDRQDQGHVRASDARRDAATPPR